MAVVGEKGKVVCVCVCVCVCVQLGCEWAYTQ